MHTLVFDFSVIEKDNYRVSDTSVKFLRNTGAYLPLVIFSTLEHGGSKFRYWEGETDIEEQAGLPHLYPQQPRDAELGIYWTMADLEGFKEPYFH